MKSLDEQRDEEEGAALVPQRRHDGDDDAHHTRTTIMESAAQRRLVTAWWRRRWAQKLVPTRAVGLVVSGILVLALLVGGGGDTSRWINLDYASSFLQFGRGGGQRWTPHHAPSPEADLVPIPFSCSNGTGSPSPFPSPASPSILKPSASKKQAPPPPRCPEYFRYIHSDLSPWRETGITREAVERGRNRAAFRLVVVDGRAYVETYHHVFQTRDIFTQWGIAQLLARYPGRVPDLDLMFNCDDMPVVRPSEQPAPPPLFRYCKDDTTVDIVFPDWSFWGWPEVNIRPWAPLLEEMAAEIAQLPWAEREPYAYWKGNPTVTGERRDLLRCNGNESSDEWRTRAFWQEWGAAKRNGFRDSNLAKQCRYRYKIFVRGRSWSVSQKYILACDSPVLLIATPYKDFFSRGLVAGKHYWPIDSGAGKCAGIKFAVDWGNAHPEQSRRMAEEGSGYARHDLSMDYVYDYMLHVLTQYAGLLRYKPTVPENAVELRAETIACPAAAHKNREFEFMMESREKYVADYEPCTLPPPFTDDEVSEMTRRDQEVRDNVHKMMATVAP